MSWGGLKEVRAECAQLKKVIRRIRKSNKSKKWRLKVIKRDEYTCQDCGKQMFVGLHAHHKKRIPEILFDNKIKTYQAALNFKPLWDIDNGKSLCPKCHLKQSRADKIINYPKMVQENNNPPRNPAPRFPQDDTMPLLHYAGPRRKEINKASGGKKKEGPTKKMIPIITPLC